MRKVRRCFSPPEGRISTSSAFAAGHFIDHDAGIGFVHVDERVFIGFLALAGFRVGAGEDFGAADGELKTFAAHLLDEDAELEFAAAGDFKSVGFVGDGDVDGDIAFGFGHQAFADLAGGDFFALAAGQRSVVDPKRHGEGWRVDGGGGQRPGQVGGADGLRHRGVGKASHRDDVAGADFLDRDALEAAEGEEFCEAAGFDHLALEVIDFDRHVQRGAALFDTAGQDPAEEGVGFQDRGDHAEGGGGVEVWGRDMGQDQIEERVEVFVRDR